MSGRASSLRWVMVAIALFVSLVAAPSRAQAPSTTSIVVGALPVLLAPAARGELEGSFRVANRGKRPAEIRVRLGDEGWAPPGLSATTEARTQLARIEPGQEARILVHWAGSTSRARELEARVVIDVDGAVAHVVPVRAVTGGAPIAMRRSLLPVTASAPLLVAFALLAARRARRSHRALSLAAGALALVHLGLVVWLVSGLDLGFGMADGNDGLQLLSRLVDHAPLGVSILTGVDGVSATLLPAASLACLIALALAPRDGADGVDLHAGAVLSLAGVSLSLVCADAALVALGVAVALAGLALAGSSRPDAARRTLLRRLAVSAAFTLVTLGAAVALAAVRVGVTVSPDGLTHAASTALPDLLRARLLSSTPGALPPAALALCLLVASSFPLLGLPPFHGLTLAASRSGSAGVAVLFVAVPRVLGVTLLVRVACLVVPEAIAWASTSLSLVGAGASLIVALAAFSERDLVHLPARLASISGGLVLVAVASCTPQGVVAGVALGSLATIALACAAASSSLLFERLGTGDTRRLGGVAFDAPRLAASLAVGLLAVAALPGTSGFWGPFLALVASAARSPSAAALSLIALALAAAAALRALAPTLFGSLPAGWRQSGYLAPFGGRIPDALVHERRVLLPLAALIVALGVAPSPWLSLCERAALDLGAFLDPPGPTQVASLDRPEVGPR